MSDISELEDDQSPVQQLLEIHRFRICAVVDRLIHKCEISLCLDKLLAHNAEIMSSHLTQHDLTSIMELNAKARKTGSSTKSVGSTSKSKIRKSASAEFKHDAFCSNMISILHQNAEIMAEVKILVKSLNPCEKRFLKRMYELRDYIHEELQTTGAKERTHNKQIGQSWVNNENYKKKNAEMEKIHSNRMYELSFKINEKKEQVHKYQNQMHETREACITNLHKIINDSERYMAKASLSSDEQQEILSEEAKLITSQYQSLLEGHLAHEKTLRIKRFKIETVLAGWIAKYDQDIGEIQERLEEQQDGYASEKAAFDDLQERFDAQTLEYDVLMVEKAQEEHRLFYLKYTKFVTNRSAKIIQRWWRAILGRRRKRRKRGKGKEKGKKKK